MLLKNGSLKGLATPLAGQHADQTLARLAPALQTEQLAGFYFQKAVPQPPIFMPDGSPVDPFASQLLPATVGTRQRPGIPSRYDHFRILSGDLDNLVVGQA